MALKGSLDDFNIVNILQMIKLEGKTGRLGLSEGEELVKITFDQGRIIYAEGAPQKDEARIQSTLLSNGLMVRSDWDLVKKEHDDKLKPYWELLAKKIPGQVLKEFLSRQVIDTVYNALRWKRGTYEFTPLNNIKYNPKMMTPMDVDGLLMEGCRIADEWTRVATSIPPLDTFLTKNIMGESEMEDDSVAMRPGAAQGDYKSSLEYEILSARGVQIDDYQAAVLSVIGSGKTIQEVLDSSRQGHYYSLEAIQTLLRLGVLQASAKKKKVMLSVDNTGKSSQFAAAAVLFVVVVGGAFWQLQTLPKAWAIQKQGAATVKKAKAIEGLKKLQRNLKIYVALKKTLPRNLEEMVEEGVAVQSDLIDPWNNTYRLKTDKSNFALYSDGPDAILGTDNVYLPSN